MSTRTLVPRAISLAIRSTLIVTTAAAAVATPTARASDNLSHDFCVIGSISVLLACPSEVNPAIASSSPAPGQMGSQKLDSAVAAYRQAQMTTAAPNDSTPAQEKPLWKRQTDSAYLAVFAYNCAPSLFDRAATVVEPHGIEVAIYTDRFRVEYASDCRAFYLSEIAPRIDQTIDQTLREAGRR